MSWGHAVSTDMLHWKHLPIALARRGRRDDLLGQRRRGLAQHERALRGEKTAIGRASSPIYTGHGHGKQTQNLAYSNDRGRTWTKYASNPVIDLNLENFRDPKAFWDESSRRWVLVTVLADQHKVRLFGSPGPEALGDAE